MELNGTILYWSRYQKLNKNVKTSSPDFHITSNFEAYNNAIVITKAVNRLHMVSAIPLKNIEEEQKVDRVTAEQIAKIIRFLRNIED